MSKSMFFRKFLENRRWGKRKPLIIMISLLMTLILLFATLFAFFSDYISGSETFTFGTLDIQSSNFVMKQHSDIGTSTMIDIAQAADVNTNSILENLNPGDAIEFALTVENKGNKSGWYYESLILTQMNQVENQVLKHKFKVYQLGSSVSFDYTVMKQVALGSYTGSGTTAIDELIAISEADNQVYRLSSKLLNGQGDMDAEIESGGVNTETMRFILYFLPEKDGEQTVEDALQNKTFGMSLHGEAIQYRNNTNFKRGFIPMPKIASEVAPAMPTTSTSLKYRENSICVDGILDEGDTLVGFGGSDFTVLKKDGNRYLIGLDAVATFGADTITGRSTFFANLTDEPYQTSNLKTQIDNWWTTFKSKFAEGSSGSKVEDYVLPVVLNNPTLSNLNNMLSQNYTKDNWNIGTPTPTVDYLTFIGGVQFVTYPSKDGIKQAFALSYADTQPYKSGYDVFTASAINYWMKTGVYKNNRGGTTRRLTLRSPGGYGGCGTQIYWDNDSAVKLSNWENQSNGYHKTDISPVLWVTITDATEIE